MRPETVAYYNLDQNEAKSESKNEITMVDLDYEVETNCTVCGESGSLVMWSNIDSNQSDTTDFIFVCTECYLMISNSFALIDK